MTKAKITVVKRVSMKDLFGDKPPANIVEETVTPQCPVFKEGQEFIYDRNCPSGFCSWAFADIQRDILTVTFGGSHPWLKDKRTTISCCTDGLRPVIFKIEAIED